MMTMTTISAHFRRILGRLRAAKNGEMSTDDSSDASSISAASELDADDVRQAGLELADARKLPPSVFKCDNLEAEMTFEEYCAEHGKVYESEMERNMREGLFKASLADVPELAADVGPRSELVAHGVPLPEDKSARSPKC